VDSCTDKQQWIFDEVGLFEIGFATVVNGPRKSGLSFHKDGLEGFKSEGVPDCGNGVQKLIIG
jgi:hypothetical protein